MFRYTCYGTLPLLISILIYSLTAVTTLTTAIAPAHAATKVVSNDRGGSVSARINEINKLRKSGTKIRIEGFCASACTLYLGLKSQVCVTETATLAFHGPSTATPGLLLPYDDFQRITAQMASYYPEPLRRWYMKEGRNNIEGLYSFTGAQLIEMGTRRCS